MDVRLPNGVIVKNVPEGTSQATLQAMLVEKGVAKAEDFAPAEASQPDDGFSVREMAGNVLPSGAQFAKDVAYPFLHPVQTAKAMGNLAKGTYQKFTPGVQPAEAYPDAFMAMMGDRYGSVDKALNTLESDPVGVLADVSGLMTGGGTLLAKTGPTAKRVAQVGSLLDPIQATRNVAGTAAGLLTPKALPREMYDSAVKWRPSIDRQNPGRREQLTETALAEDIMPTPEGLEKAMGREAILGQQVDDLLAAAEDAGASIRVADVRTELVRFQEELGGFKYKSKENQAIAAKVLESFDDMAEGREMVSPIELQAFKRDLYKQINYDAKQGTSTYAANAAEQALARGARKSLEGVSPEIADINARLGRLIELTDELPQPAARIGNRDLLGIGIPMKSMMGGAVGDVPGAATGAALGLLDLPRLKAGAALKLENLRRRGARGLLDANVPAALLTQGLFQSGRFSEE